MPKNQFGLLIKVSWVVLIICFIIKLCGGNWFEFKSENNNFINFCNFVENHNWLKMSIACIIYLISNYFIICILIDKNKLSVKQLLIWFPLMIFKSIISWYIVWLSFVLELIILVILPIIIGKKWKRVLIGNLLILSFQIINIIFRNISFYFNVSNTIIENYLSQIDYYIMIILYYLYTFKNKIIKKGDE